MTMISPQSYIDDLEGESCEQMIKERDKLIREIRHFEKHREEIMNSEEAYICPSPETIYLWNLQALGFLCMLMSEKFKEEEDNC